MTDHSVAHGQEQLPAGPLRTWIIAFTGFFLLIGAWAVATPFAGTPDENAHIIRAAGVGAGQVVAKPTAAIRGGGAFQTVPQSLIRPFCWQFHPSVPASCAPEPGGDETPVRVATGAGRYHPWYYALVGVPLALAPNWTGLILARLISAALCAALLAMALVDAMRWSRYRLMALGVLVAATPMAAMMGAAINPNGPEIAAGVALFAAAVPLFMSKSAERSRTLLWHAGIAGVTLISMRASGPLWFCVAIASVLLPWRWATLRGLWEWRPARWWGFGIGFAMIVSVVWTELLKTTFMGDFTGGAQRNLADAVLTELDYERGYFDEMVGVGSWLDTRLPSSLYLVWEGVAVALVTGGFILAGRVGRWRLAALTAGGLGIPFAMQILWVNTYGFITQGRYLLPIAVGLPILGAFLIQQYGVSADKSRAALRFCVIALLPFHLGLLWYTMVRWQHGLNWHTGLHGLNPLAGPWHPPLGPEVPLLASAAGAIVIGWFVWDAATAATRGPALAADGCPAELTDDGGSGHPDGSGTLPSDDADLRGMPVVADSV